MEETEIDYDDVFTREGLANVTFRKNGLTHYWKRYVPTGIVVAWVKGELTNKEKVLVYMTAAVAVLEED